MVPEATCKILKNGRNQQLYQAMMIMKPTGSAWCLTCCRRNSNAFAINNNALTRLKAHSTKGKYDGYWKPSQLPRACDTMDFEVEPTTTTSSSRYKS